MTMSVFDLFTVGIGPSSSHTVGPMRAACRFVERLEAAGLAAAVGRVRVELFGSLGATGHGHGSVTAVLLGLGGEQPHLVDPLATAPALAAVRRDGRLRLGGKHPIAFDADADVVLHRDRRLDAHSNGMILAAVDDGGALLDRRAYYSVGGGSVLDEDEVAAPAAATAATAATDGAAVPYPFGSGVELLALARRHRLRISDVVLADECVRRGEPEVRGSLLHLWAVMRECVGRGLAARGTLPGGLRVRRRAHGQHESLRAAGARPDGVRATEWVSLWALAVNEENAAGGRVVTAPTNGAAGIVPAVLHHAAATVPGFADDDVVRFLLAAGAVGLLVKRNASVSGAEVGCQGEVGSACAMAAAGLAEVLGGTPEQVENAAEIGLEHHLGLTCDPVGGLVQIPCIERNAVAAVTAVTAARIALRGDGEHHVSLDTAVRTMRETGADMSTKYKETARGGLALTVVEC